MDMLDHLYAEFTKEASENWLEVSWANSSIKDIKLLESRDGEKHLQG